MSQSSFLISLDQSDSQLESLLNVGFNPDVSADGGAVVKDAISQLSSLSHSLNNGGILKINGKGSVAVFAAIAGEMKNKYREIAVFDPKIKKYIVVVSTGGREVGALVD